MCSREVFKYDVIELIRAVELKPCLWDRTLDNYKDKVERKRAWQDIFKSLEAKYDTMSAEDKRKTGDHIVGKWTNVRDTFIKSLRAKTGKTKKRYIWHKFMTFLMKAVQTPEETNTEPNNDTETILIVQQETDDNKDYSPRKRKKEYDEEYVAPKNHDQDVDFVEMEEGDERVMNEDEAFFASLLPSIVKYNEDERLEFRIEVLGVMKKIKERRKN